MRGVTDRDGREQYAEVIDLGFRWDIGAPLPHVVSDGFRALVVCRLGEPDPNWDGTYINVISPRDEREDTWAVIEFRGCASLRIGAPNDEAIDGHPLAGSGLRGYHAHEVHNSAWLDEHIRMNSVHPNHSDDQWRLQRHYLLAFHDEMVEVLAHSIEAHVVRGSLRSLLVDSADALIGPTHRDARAELAHRLAAIRQSAEDAGLDPSVVDEAIEAACRR